MGMKIVAKYATLLREPAPGAIPIDGLIECGYDRIIAPSGRIAWGWAEYDRYLTEDEISRFELEYVESMQTNIKEEEGENNYE